MTSPKSPIDTSHPQVTRCDCALLGYAAGLVTAVLAFGVILFFS